MESGNCLIYLRLAMNHMNIFLENIWVCTYIKIEKQNSFVNWFGISFADPLAFVLCYNAQWSIYSRFHRMCQQTAQPPVIPCHCMQLHRSRYGVLLSLPESLKHNAYVYLVHPKLLNAGTLKYIGKSKAKAVLLIWRLEYHIDDNYNEWLVI